MDVDPFKEDFAMNDLHSIRADLYPIVASTPFYANRWVIREYANGTYDAAQTTGPAISPGLDSFDAAVQWVTDMEGGC